MKTVLVTGGTGGIGLECCKIFRDNGYRVYSVSRSEENKESGIIHIKADVTNEDSIKAAVARIIEAEGKLDILINNAGFGISGPIEMTTLEDAKRQLDVNFFGCFICSKAVLPFMRQQKSGVILNVSSVAAEVAIPFQAFYSASKSAVNSLTLCLANEVRDFGITVKAVMPGDVKTGFTAARSKSLLGEDVYKKLKKSVETMERDEENGMSPKDIAKEVFRAATSSSKKPFSSKGLQYKAILWAARLLPRKLSNVIVGKIYA